MKKILFLLFIVFVMSAFATLDGNNTIKSENVISQIMLQYEGLMQRWRDIIMPTAINIFLMLATIEIVIAGAPILFDGADISKWLAFFAQRMLIFSFFILLFNHGELLNTIPKSFIVMGNRVAGMDVTPDMVFSYGIELIMNLFTKINWLSPMSLAYALAGFLMLVCFGMIAGQLFIAYLKTWTILALSPIVYTLGALTQTRQYATGPIMAIFKASIELMALKVFIGFAYAFMAGIKVTPNLDYLLTMSGLMVAILSMSTGIGSIIESLFSGTVASTSNAGFSLVGKMAGVAGGAAAGAVSGAITGAAGTKAAYDLTKAQKAAGIDGVSFLNNMQKGITSAVFKNSWAGNIMDKKNAQKDVNDGK